MGFRCPLSSLFLAFAGAAWGANLEQARELLSHGDAAGAAQMYRDIPHGDALWPERLIDTLRWQLTRGRAMEAWRITELARRTHQEISDLDYYRALSELKAGVCILSAPVARPAWRALLRAHLYRFPSRFAAEAFSADPYSEVTDQRLPHYLGQSQTHYLADISKATLLKGTGCRWLQGRLQDRPTASAYEFNELLTWREEAKEKNEEMPGRAAVELRLLALAFQKKDEALARDLLASYTHLDSAGWLRIPDPERRYLWQKLIDAGLFAKPPYPPQEPLAELALGIAAGIKTADAGEWVALVDFSALPAARREALIAHLLTIPDGPERAYLLAAQAEIFFARGDIPAALANVRRLLLLEEAGGSSEVTDTAVHLATAIFTEFHYDEQVLGAIQNSLPAGDWGRIFRQLFMEHALVGEARGFELLGKRVTKAADVRAVRLDADEQALLTAMARRRRAAFEAVLKSWAKERRLSARTLSFLADLGTRTLQLTPTARAAVQPYLQDIARFLQERDGGSTPRVAELVELFRSGDSAYSRGATTVRDGTVKAGVVDLSQKSRLSFPFTWSPPASLPLRDLLVQPQGDRGWEIR